jgi:hypothetical protein
LNVPRYISESNKVFSKTKNKEALYAHVCSKRAADRVTARKLPHNHPLASLHRARQRFVAFSRRMQAADATTESTTPYGVQSFFAKFDRETLRSNKGSRGEAASPTPRRRKKAAEVPGWRDIPRHALEGRVADIKASRNLAWLLLSGLDSSGLKPVKVVVLCERQYFLAETPVADESHVIGASFDQILPHNCPAAVGDAFGLHRLVKKGDTVRATGFVGRTRTNGGCVPCATVLRFRP